MRFGGCYSLLHGPTSTSPACPIDDRFHTQDATDRTIESATDRSRRRDYDVRMSSTARDIWDEMTPAERNEMEAQLREAETKPTLAELIERIRARPGHRSYEGPPIVDLVRAQRAERDAQIDKHFGL